MLKRQYGYLIFTIIIRKDPVITTILQAGKQINLLKNMS